uniref:Uncharacterized protein n=1 Tax=Pyxicephalus adspersus TaxID=30357 RepID=A0AAV3ACQ6_PYXAD|nr:TPA: hypothetical protein GDO54_013193 [Pyxicephalus adspersus]
MLLSPRRMSLHMPTEDRRIKDMSRGPAGSSRMPTEIGMCLFLVTPSVTQDYRFLACKIHHESHSGIPLGRLNTITHLGCKRLVLGSFSRLYRPSIYNHSWFCKSRSSYTITTNLISSFSCLECACYGLYCSLPITIAHVLPAFFFNEHD